MMLKFSSLLLGMLSCSDEVACLFRIHINHVAEVSLHEQCWVCILLLSLMSELLERQPG